MTVDALRAHILAQIEALEDTQERVRDAPQGSLGTRNDGPDSWANGTVYGALEAYRDVLARLPGAVTAG